MKRKKMKPWRGGKGSPCGGYGFYGPGITIELEPGSAEWLACKDLVDVVRGGVLLDTIEINSAMPENRGSQPSIYYTPGEVNEKA